MWRSKSITRRSILALGAAAASAAVLTACSGSSGAPAPAAGGSSSIVWSTWGTPEELTRFNEFNKQFMERHPDIKVKLQPVASYGEYHSKQIGRAHV